MAEAILRESKQKRAGASAPALPCPAALALQPMRPLLDADVLARGSGFLRQRQLEHAVGEFRLRSGIVDVLWQQ